MEGVHQDLIRIEDIAVGVIHEIKDAFWYQKLLRMEGPCEWKEWAMIQCLKHFKESFFPVFEVTLLNRLAYNF